MLSLKVYPMAQQDQSPQISTILKSAAAYGLWFAVVGSLVGWFGSVVGGTVYEYISGTSGDAGRSLFLLTTPIGAFLGIIYGIWKEVG